MKRKKSGSVWILAGLLLIAAALLLVGYNLLRQSRADRISGEILQKLEVRQTEAGQSPEQKSGGASASSQTSIDDIIRDMPDYELNPYLEMPVETIDGYDYIGRIEIPALDLALPVLSEWDYTRLNIAPCRFTGSVYQNNLILCAHNYDRHFGQIKKLQPGDEVIFTDAAGNEFRFRVVELETFRPYETENMMAGDWDLTMFTCTIAGNCRMTVRCERADR